MEKDEILQKLKISYKKIQPLFMDVDEAKRFEEIYFKAEFEGEEVAHMIASRVVSPEDFDEEKYFFEGRTIPFAAFGGTNEAYWGMGIGQKVNSFANDYYIKKIGENLYSDLDNSEAGKRTWSRMVEKGLAEKVMDNPDRWKFKKL